MKGGHVCLLLMVSSVTLLMGACPPATFIGTPKTNLATFIFAPYGGGGAGGGGGASAANASPFSRPNTTLLGSISVDQNGMTATNYTGGGATTSFQNGVAIATLSFGGPSGGISLPASLQSAISGGSTGLSGLGGTIGLTGGFGP